MNLSSLSSHTEADRHPISRPNSGTSKTGSGTATEHAADVFEELRAQRVQLEMQNRALREAESEIEAACQRYSDLYDHLPIGCVTLTSNGRIVHANLTAAGWLRRDRAQLPGTYFSWFLDAFDAGRFAAHLDSCLQTRSEQTLTLTLRLENALLMTVELTSRLAPHAPDGEPQLHTAITNIRNLKQAHAIGSDIAAEQQGDAQTLSESVGAPLTTIRKYARGLMRDRASDLEVELTNTIERMECAAVRMETTLHHLLEYCCLGQEEVALDPVSLEELLQHVMMEYRLLIERHGVEIVVERPLPCVRGARLLLGQILASVLIHALKRSTPEDRPRLRIHATREDGEVVLRVTNESPPLDEAPAADDFRLFERLEKDGYHGAAVGLAVIRQAIGRMKGRVWVDSAVGRIISFNVGLPSV